MDDDEHYRERFPREDIEIGIDGFISELIKAKILATKSKPSLWQVFQSYYGDEHPIVKLVEEFEDHVKGYFDLISYEDMGAAFNDIVKVRNMVQEDLDKAHA